jgi:hypothetical protein
MNWGVFRSQVLADDKRRVDYDHLKFGDLAVDPGEGEDPQPKVLFPLEDRRVSWDLTDRAYAHYLGKLGIPHGFATKFSPGLQGDMIAERLRDASDAKESEIFMRGRPGVGQVRGILSGRYGDMRDRQVVEILDNLMGEDLEQYQVLRGRASDHLLSVTMIGHEPVHTNGDKYFPIIQVRNSELGFSSFSATSGICKGFCWNGMIFGHRTDSRARIRHLGSKMSESVNVALNKALGSVEKWSETIAPAIHNAQGIIINLEDAREAAKVVKQIRDRGLTKRFADQALKFAREMPEEIYQDEFASDGDGKVSLWTVVNSMTHLAQNLTPEGQFEVESAAGALLLARAA